MATAAEALPVPDVVEQPRIATMRDDVINDGRRRLDAVRLTLTHDRRQAIRSHPA
jgi:hypothetical protein